jgi:hypothetical protein
MSEIKINEDYLLLLVDNNGTVDINTIEIKKHFEHENEKLSELCGIDGNDNINQIISFIRNSLQSKLPNRTFKYCKELDKAYQSVHVNIEIGIKGFLDSRELIFTNQKISQKEGKDFDLVSKFRDLKSQIKEKIELWFKVFDIEFAYEKAKKISNVLSYSHRISGWSNPEYKITENLKQEIKTNFGYGSVSYFYLLFTFKNIQITPLSEWVDYRYSNFSEVIRYTRSFRSRIPVTNERGQLKYYKTSIKNEYWNNAIHFTKDSANLSITNENEFIEKYIITECETMVKGLENFYKNNGFDLIDEDQIDVKDENTDRYRLDLKGFELISFKTEKIIGALDFISKIIEYNSIIPTQEYVSRIKSINNKFIPNVLSALKEEKEKLSEVNKDLKVFLVEHNKLVQKNEFYRTERIRLKANFDLTYKEEFIEFQKELKISLEKLAHYNQKIKLHTENIEKLNEFIEKYNNFMKE